MRTINKLLLFFILFINTCFSYEYELAICAIFRDEAPYLKEWIDYHIEKGVDHFYLYNNESKDNYKEVLNKYIKKGIVELNDWPNQWKHISFSFGCQLFAYQNCLWKNPGKCKWIAFIDIDEFIVPMKKRNIKKVLRKYEERASAVYVSWRVFGTSYINAPKNQLLPYLTKCSARDNKVNIWGKTIVRPEFVDKCDYIHFFTLLPGNQYFNGDGKPLGPIFNDAHHDKEIRINHYIYKDERYLRTEKVKKWGKEMLNYYLKLNDEYCIEENFDILK